MTNPFFKNKGPFEINKLLKFAELKNIQKYSNFETCIFKNSKS